MNTGFRSSSETRARRVFAFCLFFCLTWVAGAGAQTSPAPANPTQAGAPQKPTQTPDSGFDAPLQNQQPAATSVKTDTNPAPNPALQLGSGDLVEVSVYNVPELATKARIGANGDLYLPLIDYVHVAGLTVDEAQSIIEKRYTDGGFVKNPHVSVFVDSYASQGASLLGEVLRPGIYPVLGGQRLFDLLSAAGGLTEKAGNSVTITHRNQPDHPVTVPLARNVAEVPDSNIPIFPGDTVVIRRADIVYVVGDVQHPTGILMDRGSLTVLQAVALAGGTTSTSKLNSARIIRKGPNGMTETKVRLKKVLQAKLPDIQMQPDDILFIPNSAFKSALHTDASIALQASSVGLIAAR